jgi:hypothetical protein
MEKNFKIAEFMENEVSEMTRNRAELALEGTNGKRHADMKSISNEPQGDGKAVEGQPKKMRYAGITVDHFHDATKKVGSIPCRTISHPPSTDYPRGREHTCKREQIGAPPIPFLPALSTVPTPRPCRRIGCPALAIELSNLCRPGKSPSAQVDHQPSQSKSHNSKP